MGDFTSARLLSSSLLIIALASAAAPAETKVGDKVWTQCVWKQAPVAADKWLSMPLPTWQSPVRGANVLLGHKLIALCDDTASNPLKPNRTPNWKDVSAALRRGKPKTAEAMRAGPATRVVLCESRIVDGAKPAPFLYEISKTVAGRDVAMFQQYVGNINGEAVKLPQDLRIMPSPGKAVERTCRTITDEGELTDG